jgi:PPM family protein phosphatase
MGAVEIALRTDPGRDPEKQVNEDACAEQSTRFGHLVVVCDGMGGHAGGREASQLAVRVILDAFAKAASGTASRDVLAQAIREANRRVFTMTTPIEEKASGGRPGSTVVAVLVHAEGTEVAHVGDSRAYLVHGGQIFQLTRDHSAVQRMVDENLISPAEAARHPEANKILRALGIAPDVEVEVRAQPVAHVAGDTLLLCSDGLSDLVAPEDVLAIAASAPVQQAAGQLVDLANARGGHDNITVAIVRTRESAVRAREVAPTVTQTLSERAPKPLAPTVLQTPGPPAVLPPPFLPAPGRAPARQAQGGGARPSSSGLPLAIAGIVLALLGLAALSYAMYLHNEDRGGRKHVAPAISGEALGASAAPPGPVQLAPFDASSPPPSLDFDAAIEPLQPLEPAPDAGRRRRHHDDDDRHR